MLFHVFNSFESTNRVKVSIFHLLAAYPFLFLFPWLLYFYSIKQACTNSHRHTSEERSGMCRAIQRDHRCPNWGQSKKYWLRFFPSFLRCYSWTSFAVRVCFNNIEHIHYLKKGKITQLYRYVPSFLYHRFYCFFYKLNSTQLKAKKNIVWLYS